jgi:hypothetical protein
MITGASEIVNAFLESMHLKLDAMYSEQLTRVMAQNNNECTPAIMNQVFNQIQTENIDINMLNSGLSFLNKILQMHPSRFDIMCQQNLFENMLKLGLMEIAQKRIQEKIQLFAVTLCTKVEQQIQKENNQV